MKERRALPKYCSDVHPDPAYGLGLVLTANEPDAHPFGHGGTGPGSKIAVYAQVHRVQPYGRPRSPRLIPMCGSCRCLATEACTAALRRSRISLRNLVWSDSCRSYGRHRKENERLSRDQATLLLRGLKTATIPVVKIGAILHHGSIIFWRGAHFSSVTSNYIYYSIPTCIRSGHRNFFLCHVS